MSLESTPGTEPVGAFDSHALVRFSGIAVIVFGIYVGFTVVTKAWELYNDPSLVSNLTTEIEKQSHVNAFVERVIGTYVGKRKSVDDPNAAPTDVEKLPPDQLNAAYFAAWFLLFGLLGLVGKIACWIVGAGAKVASVSAGGDKQLRTVLERLILEVKTSARN